MKTLLYIFILLPFLFYSIQVGFVAKRYFALLTPTLVGKTIQWNKNVDNLKLWLTFIAVVTPCFILKTALAPPIDDAIFRVGSFIIALIFSGICLWFEVFKVGKMKCTSYSNGIKTKLKVSNETLFLEVINLKVEIAKNNQQIINTLKLFQNSIAGRPTKASKTGPKPFSQKIFTAIKYGLIHHFNINKRNEDLIDSKKAFYKKVSNQDGFNIKTDYTTFWNETKNLDRYFEQKTRINYIEPLLSDDQINLYPNIVKFLNDLKERINSN